MRSMNRKVRLMDREKERGKMIRRGKSKDEENDKHEDENKGRKKGEEKEEAERTKNW